MAEARLTIGRVADAAGVMRSVRDLRPQRHDRLIRLCACRANNQRPTISRRHREKRRRGEEVTVSPLPYPSATVIPAMMRPATI